MRDLYAPLISFAVIFSLFGSMVSVTTSQDTNADILIAVENNNIFAWRLYQQVQTEADGNLMIAPYSISQALAMTYAGASGTTESQIADVMNFTLPQNQLHAALSMLNDDLMLRGNTLDEDLQDTGAPTPALNIANAFWGEQTFPFRQNYIDDMQEFYVAGLQLTDFLNDPEVARLAINDWVARQTNDRIKDIVPPNMVHPQVVWN